MSFRQSDTAPLAETFSAQRDFGDACARGRRPMPLRYCSLLRQDDGPNHASLRTAAMTMTGDRFGVSPTGRRAEIPAVFGFRFADGLICYERFLYDLSELCSQSGVSRMRFGANYSALPTPGSP